jgi:hypothetical protein
MSPAPLRAVFAASDLDGKQLRSVHEVSRLDRVEPIALIFGLAHRHAVNAIPPKRGAGDQQDKNRHD